MHTPFLLILTSATTVVILLASTLLTWRWRMAHKHEPSAIVRIADLSASGNEGRRWWLGMLSPLLLVAGTAASLQLRWQKIPQRFPIHWGIDGQPNHWVTRSFPSVFGSLLFDSALVIAFCVLGELIVHFSPGYRGRSKMVRATRGILLACAWFVTALFCLISLLPLSQSPTHFVPLIALGAIVFSLGITGYAIVLALQMEQIVIAGQNSTDKRYWKAGLLYFNPGDSALMVPKRNGFGYTLNFGRPLCWVIFALILMLPLILPALLLHSH